MVTEYFYSGSVVMAEKTGSAWTDYIFFGGQRIAQQTGATASTANYLHTDHLGSTRVCTDGNGASNGTCDYEPFGEIQGGASCSVPTNYLFAGMEFDAETGLYHTAFRQYDPTQGRWLEVDPLPGTEDAPQSQNRFVYVLSDPANLIDPVGLQECSFNIHMNFQLLPGSEVQNAFKKELSRIFGAAGVGVNFGAAGGSDFIINATTSLMGAGTGKVSSPNVFGSPHSNVAYVFVDRLLSVSPQSGSRDLGTASARVGAHEMGHIIYGTSKHQIPRLGNLYEFSIMKPEFDPFSEALAFPRANARDIQDACEALHPSDPAPPAPQAGGGRGGDGRGRWRPGIPWGLRSLLQFELWIRSIVTLSEIKRRFGEKPM